MAALSSHSSLPMAEQIVIWAYEDGLYERPPTHLLQENGGTLIHSSNDAVGNSGWSFSPTEEWQFQDGSVVCVAYRTDDVISPKELARRNEVTA